MCPLFKLKAKQALAMARTIAAKIQEESAYVDIIISQQAVHQEKHQTEQQWKNTYESLHVHHLSHIPVDTRMRKLLSQINMLLKATLPNLQTMSTI
jgi:hypothetical protein